MFAFFFSLKIDFKYKKDRKPMPHFGTLGEAIAIEFFKILLKFWRTKHTVKPVQTTASVRHPLVYDDHMSSRAKFLAFVTI